MRFLSFSLSFVINLLLVTTLFLSLSFSLKPKEEVKITLLEMPSLPLESFSPPRPPERELKSPSLPIPAHPKKQPQIPPQEESLLREKINKLQKQQRATSITDEEGRILREKLARLEGRRGEERKTEHKEPTAALNKEPKDTTFKRAEGRLSEEDLWLVKRKLQNHFEVPIYLKNKRDLSALVELEVSSTGEIKRITFLKRGEDPLFDRAVERCLVAVSPLPVDKEVKIKIEFRSEGSLIVN